MAPAVYLGCGADRRCGTAWAYNLGGRCDDCRAAKRAAQKPVKRTGSSGAKKRGRRPAPYLGCGADRRCGTPNAYNNLGGRCDACLQAKQQQKQQAGSRRSDAASAAPKKPAAPKPLPGTGRYAGCALDRRCGTMAGYLRGGRCEECRHAKRADVAKKRHK